MNTSGNNMKFKKLFQELEEYILKKYGECCDEFDIRCETCLHYMVLQTLHTDMHEPSGEELALEEEIKHQRKIHIS